MIAVFYKDAYGCGQMVDVSALEAVSDHIRGNFALFSHEISQLPESRLKSNFPWIWECGDGYVSMSFVLQHWWDSLKELMGNPEWTDSEEYAEAKELIARADDAAPLVARWLKQYTRRELFDMLQEREVPCFPVYTVGEVMDSEHYAERDFFALQRHPVAGDVPQPGPPVRMRDTPWSLERPAPVARPAYRGGVQRLRIPTLRGRPPGARPRRATKQTSGGHQSPRLRMDTVGAALHSVAGQHGSRGTSSRVKRPHGGWPHRGPGQHRRDRRRQP